MRETPHDSALITARGHLLTYQELDERARAVAAALTAAGVRPEDAVGVSVTGTEHMVIGALGVLMAGGGYVPLDAGYPAARRAAMIGDAGAHVVLVDPTTSAGYGDMTCRLLDIDEAMTHDPTPVTAVHDADPDALAYVVFTSGSTGGPRGVATTHAAVVNMATHQPYAAIDRTSRVAQAASHSFDACAWEIWGALLNGATLVEVDRRDLLDPERLRAALQLRGVTAMLVVTALFHRLVEQDPALFAQVDTVLFGGEAADPRRVADVLAARPPRRLVHMYGPAETATYASWHQVRDCAATDDTVPIGTPLRGYELHVLDERLRPVAAPDSGELYIGGAFVARGYAERAGETAAHFVADPFARTPGRRLYRTGDLVRRHTDGTLAFVGRADLQVKVSGYRVELGEIEAAIEERPDVGDAVVLQDEQDGVRALVACVRPRAGGTADQVDQDALRAWLAEALPSYMIPHRTLVLDAFPLSPNGKVDRQALRRRLRGRPTERHDSGTDVRERRDDASDVTERRDDASDVTERLLTLCGDVLGVDALSPENSLLESGGHSLAVMRIIGRVKEELGVRLRTSMLLDPNTALRDIAHHIAEHRATRKNRTGSISERHLV
ncbi:non-ribosomal peptide synthetase [Streptomyces aureocirculatus]|uniref:non-ribosomal peptide synthetase n=1 Tax=Streptomyces aureocirculatus TaxID=67275 RepID=UPI0004C4EACD|nr:non-ribosomal peptide synthetase [Streptomyces aureocirculatus]